MRHLVRVLDVRVDLLFEKSSDCDREVAQSEPPTLDIEFHLSCSLPQFRYGPGKTRSLVTITLN